MCIAESLWGHDIEYADKRKLMPWAVLNRQSTTSPDEALAHVFKGTTTEAHTFHDIQIRVTAGDTKVGFTRLVYSTFFASNSTFYKEPSVELSYCCLHRCIWQTFAFGNKHNQLDTLQFHYHFIEVKSLDMFRALLAHHQETVHVCSFGDLCAVVDVGWSQDSGTIKW
jgi:hypothetical protein